MPILSIIVPVYNAEKYLSRCIESILGQNYSDIEVLLINDGSADSSGTICEIYAEKDSRIRVLHKENGGVSSARNLGIDNAKGIYITFVDADDWLAPDTFDNDTFCGDYDLIRFPRNICTSGKNYLQDVFCKNHSEVLKFLCEDFCNACWGRLYKKQAIQNIKFDEEVVMGEDIIFFLSILPNINSYHIIAGTSGYNYSINEDSVCNKLGCTYELDKLTQRICKFIKHDKRLAWKILLQACYSNCTSYDISDKFIRNVCIFHIINAPIDLKVKYKLLRMKIHHCIIPFL